MAQCFTLKLYQILTDFQFFYCQNREKMCNNLLLKISAHFKCVATLLCEMSTFYRSCHWPVASPAWVRRPAARRTHETFDVKTAGCDRYFRQ